MTEDLQQFRNEIDQIDKDIISLLSKRLRVVRQVAEYKVLHNLPIYQPEREKELYERIKKLANESGVGEQLAESIFKNIVESSKKSQESVIERESRIS